MNGRLARMCLAAWAVIGAVCASAEVPKAVDAGTRAEDILNVAMIPAMAEVGRLFEAGEFFIPEMLVAARTMSAGMELIKPQIVAMSALVTTTMPAMGKTIEAIAAAGLRSEVKVMVGGAPLSQAYSDSIGADGYSADANSAVALAKKLAA